MLHTAAAVRHALVAQQPRTGWSRTLGGACGTATLVLCHLLRRKGFDPIPATGWVEHADDRSAFGSHSHAWVMLDDLILDVTATQFADQGGPALPEVYVRAIGYRESHDPPVKYDLYHVGALAHHSITTWAQHVAPVNRRAHDLMRWWTLLQLTTWTKGDETESAAFCRHRYSVTP